MSCPYASASGMSATGGAKSKKPRKLTNYAKFVKKFASENKGLKGPDLMRKAGAKWRGMSDAEKAKVK